MENLFKKVIKSPNKIKILTPLALVILNLFVQPTSATPVYTVSGIAAESNIRFNLERVCLVDTMSANQKFAFKQDPTIEVGVFKAYLNPKTGELSEISRSLRSHSRIAFFEEADDIQEGAMGATDFTFKNFEFEVPLHKIESLIAETPLPRGKNRVSTLVDAALGTAQEPSVLVIGLYLKVGGVKSLVAFRGQYSRIIKDLMSTDDTGNYYYDLIWPKIATLLNNERRLQTFNSGHGGYRSVTDCSNQSFVTYGIELVNGH